MCGIFGYFDSQRKEIARPLVEKMGREIHHRGPDDQGIFYGEAMAIGNQRLSIIDIAGGHQPFISDDGMIAVVQNGEIFNHIELAQELKGTRYECRTHSDTEVLLRLYEKEGIDFVKRLNGMFAIAIYDKRDDALYLIRDRIGVKPLFVSEENGRILFASEIKSILQVGSRKEMNLEAIHHYLSLNYVPPPMTAFKGVYHVKPGHWVRYDRQGHRTESQWWSLAEVGPEDRSEKQWISDLMEVLDDAVRLRLRADVPFGAFLSGGVDSSTIVGLMARHMNRPVKTFNIGFHDPRYDESPFALEAAKRFHTEHISEKVEHNMLGMWEKAMYYCDQPHGDISFLPTYRVSQLAAQHVKMVLTGDGGDELFAGYEKYQNFFTPDVFGVTVDKFKSTYFDNISLFKFQDQRRLYSSKTLENLNETDTFKLVDGLFTESRHWDRINQALYIDMQLLLPGNNLVKPDRMGMAVSLEARTPFLDYRMMELAFKMPGNLKLKDGETKYLLKKAVTPLIGEELAYRKKQMFTVPVGDWFKKELVVYCRELLMSKNSLSTMLFNTEVIEKMLNDHISGFQNNTREIRALLALEHWAHAFDIEYQP